MCGKTRFDSLAARNRYAAAAVMKDARPLAAWSAAAGMSMGSTPPSGDAGGFVIVRTANNASEGRVSAIGIFAEMPQFRLIIAQVDVTEHRFRAWPAGGAILF